MGSLYRKFDVDPTFLFATLADMIGAVRAAAAWDVESNVHQELLSLQSSLEDALKNYLSSSEQDQFEAAIDIFRQNRIAGTFLLTLLKAAQPDKLCMPAGLAALRSTQHLAEALKDASEAVNASSSRDVIAEAPGIVVGENSWKIQGFVRPENKNSKSKVQFCGLLDIDHWENRLSRAFWEKECLEGQQDQDQPQQTVLIEELGIPLEFSLSSSSRELRNPIRLEFDLTEDVSHDIYFGRQFLAQNCVLSSEEVWLLFDEKYYQWLEAQQLEALGHLLRYGAFLPSPQRGTSKEADKAARALWSVKQTVASLEQRKERTEAAADRARRKEQKEEEARGSKSKGGPADPVRDAKYWEEYFARERKNISDWENGTGHWSGAW